MIWTRLESGGKKRESPEWEGRATWPGYPTENHDNWPVQIVIGIIYRSHCFCLSACLHVCLPACMPVSTYVFLCLHMMLLCIRWNNSLQGKCYRTNIDSSLFCTLVDVPWDLAWPGQRGRTVQFCLSWRTVNFCLHQSWRSVNSISVWADELWNCACIWKTNCEILLVSEKTNWELLLVPEQRWQ